MDSNRLVLEAGTASDARQMAAVLALGACLAVREGAVTPEFACDKLFRPVFIQKLRALGLEEQMLDLLSEALELEDLAGLAEAGVAPLIDRVINAMIAVGSLLVRQQNAVAPRLQACLPTSCARPASPKGIWPALSL